MTYTKPRYRSVGCFCYLGHVGRLSTPNFRNEEVKERVLQVLGRVPGYRAQKLSGTLLSGDKTLLLKHILKLKTILFGNNALLCNKPSRILI